MREEERGGRQHCNGSHLLPTLVNGAPNPIDQAHGCQLQSDCRLPGSSAGLLVRRRRRRRRSVRRSHSRFELCDGLPTYTKPFGSSIAIEDGAGSASDSGTTGAGTGAGAVGPDNTRSAAPAICKVTRSSGLNCHSEGGGCVSSSATPRPTGVAHTGDEQRAGGPVEGHAVR
jgi:hypothetical protein